MTDFHVALSEAKVELTSSGLLFKKLFEHGTLEVELYKPHQKDFQKPHERDEVYIIAEGSGLFNLEDKQIAFTKGDFFFVPAGKEHRFENFTEDFCTWVLFYGPKGGEK